MPQDEHNEWPSFKTVLRDVATSERSPRPETSAPRDSITDELHLASGDDIQLGTTKTNSSVKVEERPKETQSDSFGLDLLPEPLAPVDIDTSAIRALLLPPTDSPAEEFDLRALDPLEPASTIDLDEALETDSALATESAFETGSPFETESALETDSPFETDSAFEPESVFDLAFDADSATTADDPTTFAEVKGIALPQLDATPDIFGDLNFTSDISLDDVPQFSDTDETVDEGFTEPSIDLFDLQTTSKDIESERLAETGDDLYALALSDEQSDDQSSGFDSVATANAIEGELNELSDLTALDSDFVIDDEAPVEMFNLDNVVPIRPEAAPNYESADAPGDLPGNQWLNPTDLAATPLSHAADGPPPARVSHTGWVGLEDVQSEPIKNEPTENEEKVDDPWAHMRPTEDPKSEGLLARFFGGEERKRAKARRRAQERTESEPDSTETDVEASFDSACPNCGGECQVDLDDPIGRRVHVSCPSCDHMWFTPYVEANTG